MENAKYTQGPWEAFVTDEGSILVSDSDKVVFPICEVFRYNGEANAHLIAAAPELLAALEFILVAAGDLDQEAITKARAAITKAKSQRRLPWAA